MAAKRRKAKSKKAQRPAAKPTRLAVPRKPGSKPRPSRAKPPEALIATRRPTDYRPEFCEQVRKLCLLGATDVEIADFFGKAESTIALWKLKHPEFSESIKAGKTFADMDVAVGLHKRAKGYTRKVEKAFCYEGCITTAVIEEEVLPDVAAGFIWLKNRRKDHWRDKIEHSHEGRLDVNLDEVRDGINSKLSRLAALGAAAGVPKKPD